MKHMSIAIVHDWLVTRGGAELVLDEMLAVFPDAHIFTLIDKRAGWSRSEAAVAENNVTTSWMQRIPGIEKNYRSWLPLMPLAMKSLDVSKYDVVISNSHAVAKGIQTHRSQLHICYCLSPMRYAWDLKAQYLREAELDHGLKGALASAMLERMRLWDLENTRGVDEFTTLSKYIAERIRRAYGRTAEVIYPPVDTDFFTPSDEVRGEESSRDVRGEEFSYYVTASRFVPYKRIDMIVTAFRQLSDRKLVVIGDGPDEEKIRTAAGPNVEFKGRLSREEVRAYLRRAHAFIFAAEEDFGIAPVEAQACGTPVIAYGEGGALETIRGLDHPSPSGVFFPEQTAESLAAAVQTFEGLPAGISATACRESALRFRAEIFREKISAVVRLPPHPPSTTRHPSTHQSPVTRQPSSDGLRGSVRVAIRRVIGERIFASFRGVWWSFKLRWTAYEAETRILHNVVSRGGVCLDVGGNFGQFSSYLSRAVGDAGHVFTFEPLEYNRMVAGRVLARLRRHNVSIIPLAVGGSRGSVSFVVDALNTAEAHVDAGDGETVEMVDLDSWANAMNLSRLDLVKIDVEGYELRVLEGARQLLARFRPAIICEISGVSDERYGIARRSVFEFLAARDYIPHIVRQGRLVKYDNSGDALNYVFLAANPETR